MNTSHYPTLPLIKQPAPFTNPDWLFEIKYDGFRSLAFIESETCTLVSRKGTVYTRFKRLAAALSRLPGPTILDGEIACVDDEGRTQFNDLMFANAPAHFFAFDILLLDDVDLRDEPCIVRKQKLQDAIQIDIPRLHYVDHVEGAGEKLFDLVCGQDMEGIVAKPTASPYREQNGKTPWIKIKNTEYSQAEGRGDWFNADAGT